MTVKRVDNSRWFEASWLPSCLLGFSFSKASVTVCVAINGQGVRSAPGIQQEGKGLLILFNSVENISEFVTKVVN